MFCVGVLSLTGISAQAAEYFVSKDGSDSNDGLSRDRAFLTIQSGVDALRAGDTLTIGPGEYSENVQRNQLGHAESDTIIRAAVPGTVLLRGDVPAPSFRQVPGRRFTWVAKFHATESVQMVSEADSLTILKPMPNPAELEYSAGSYFYDAAARKLYISTSDREPPSRHRYTVSVTPAHGLYLLNPERVVIEGLAVTGFNTARELPWQQMTLMSTWGIFLAQATDCVIRDCRAYSSGRGPQASSASTSPTRCLPTRCLPTRCLPGTPESKAEFVQLGGSVKDRAALRIIEEARGSGVGC